jgi:hypothetical protein
MRAFLLRKGTIIITILITKIQDAARGLNTRTSLTKFFKACPPSGRTTDLFLSRVYGGHEGGRRRGGGYVVDFIYCLRSTRLPLSLPEALARFPLEIYNPHDTVRGCDGTIGFCNQHEVTGEQLCLPPPSSPFSSRESPCPSHPEHDLGRASRSLDDDLKSKKKTRQNDKKRAKAQLDEEFVTAKSKKALLEEELHNLELYLVQIHHDCDFLLANFEADHEARIGKELGLKATESMVTKEDPPTFEAVKASYDREKTPEDVEANFPSAF